MGQCGRTNQQHSHGLDGLKEKRKNDKIVNQISTQNGSIHENSQKIIANETIDTNDNKESFANGKVAKSDSVSTFQDNILS